MAACAAMTLVGAAASVATPPANPAPTFETGTRPIPERKALRRTPTPACRVLGKEYAAPAEVPGG